MSKAVAVSDSQFQAEVLESTLPVVVDFWAPWCGPCRMITPVIETLSEEFDGKVRFAKVNVDDDPQKAAEFGVQGIPALLFFKDGQLVDRVIGAVPEAQLRAKVLEAFQVSAKA